MLQTHKRIRLHHIDTVLEECLTLKQRAEHAKFLLKGQNVAAFLPEGIQIEDLPNSLVSQLAELKSILFSIQ